MRIKDFLIGLSLLFTCCLTGQESETKILTGQIVVETGEVIGVALQNMTKKTATITDENGTFRVSISLADTLVFSAVHLQRKIIVITPDLFKSSKISVPMELFVNELEGVTVNPFGLSGELMQDVEKITTEKVVDAATLGLPNAFVPKPTQSERRLYEATTGSGFIPLNPILNAISGRTKRLKKRVAQEEKDNRIQKMKKHFGKEVFQQHFQVDTTNINQFLLFCESDTNFKALLKEDNQLLLWEFLKKKGTEFGELNSKTK